MSASLMVGSMYCSKAGFTNLLYCLMTPSMSRPRSVMSLRSRRTSRMSESVSTKSFISRSCRWKEQTPSDGFSRIHFSSSNGNNRRWLLFTLLNTSSKRKTKKISPYLKKLFVRKRHNSFKYDHAGTVHVFLHRGGKTTSVQSRKLFIKSQFSF